MTDELLAIRCYRETATSANSIIIVMTVMTSTVVLIKYPRLEVVALFLSLPIDSY